MGDVDPDMLLEWLEMGHDDVRDMQLIALEQLCMLLLMSDNIDQCFESCPPRTFLPALCHIFMDATAPENILEATARAMRFYLDVSAECTRRIVSVEGAVKALCDRLCAKSETRTGKDLAEQCIKVLEFMVTREAGLIFQAGGLPAILGFISDNQSTTHKDILHSAMAVVSKLCTKCEPTDETLPGCVVTLSDLLDHPDNQVSDGALRCFASLSDRFTRKNIDPAPIGEHGLVENLLDRLTAALPSSYTPVRSPAGNRPQTANSQAPSEGTVSMVISLLSALCRGSASITKKLLQSNLPDAISAALLANERCVLDTMRLIDLLLLLMFEGRRALPRSTQPTTSAANMATDSANHKQLIDRIRSKDANALIELMENGNYDVNFMDDVGQTLLNWASAFGTLAMVEYLIKKGADVNRGQRSSSLHYTACFGRPAITKALLRTGANPDLRDEDGKTPLDRAREKNDEGHREVVHILQNPAEWMSEEHVTTTAAGDALPTTSAATQPKDQDALSEIWIRDDELIVKYLTYWIPQFTDIFHNTLYTSVRKSSLTLLRKIVRYLTPGIITQLCSAGTPYSAQVVEAIAAVLEVENEEGTVPALSMVRDLCEKGYDIFMEHFCRLGVINNITKKAKLYTEEKLKLDKDEHYMEDAVEVLPYRPYHWCQWSVLHAKECIYLWCDYTAISLSSGSNGWFSFIMDGKLSTIYSAGCLDSNGTDSSESRCEFLEKLQRAKCQVASDKPSQPVLSTPGHTIHLDKWSLKCRREGELAIDNTEGQQSTILREDLPGFIFESNKGATHSFNAELTLGSEFAAGWGKKTCKVKTKSKQLQQQINILSEEIYTRFFENKMNHMRPVVAQLKEILSDIESAVSLHNEVDGEEWRELLAHCFNSLAELLHNDSSLSTFELNSCQLVPCLLRALGNEVKQRSCTVKQQNAINTGLHKSLQRVEVFKQCFLEGNKGEMATTLVKKLVNVMESVENLPLYLYESPGALYSLQILTKRVRFRLERYAGEHTLLDRSGRTLKIEPMTAVSTLEDYLRKNVAKQWFDYDRSTYKFIREVKEAGSIVFKYSGTDFDENGIIYWIGTNGRTSKDWKNPSSIKSVMLSSSDGRNLPYGSLDDVLSRTSAAKNVHTSDDKNGWISVDLAMWVVPSHYTLRHSRGFGRSALRNWLFQVSKDSKAWVTLRSHVEDNSLTEPGSTATWDLEPPKDEKQGWRHFRVHLNGKNSSGQTHYLSISGFELYGTVTGVCEDPPMELQPTKPSPHMIGADRALKRLNRDADTLLCRQRLRFYRRQVIRNLGSRPSRVDWKALQSDTESIKSCSSTGGEAIPGTPDSTEAVGGSETLSIGTISSTPDVNTVDEIEDTSSVTSRQDTLTAFNQRNLATDLESFVLELAQAVMDTNETDRSTVYTINELLGAMPHRSGRSATDALFTLDQISSSSRAGSSNTVEQNNNLNKSKTTEKYHFQESKEEEEEEEDDDDEEFSDIPEPTDDSKDATPTDSGQEVSLNEIIPSIPEDSGVPQSSEDTSRTTSSSDYLTPDTTSETDTGVSETDTDILSTVAGGSVYLTDFGSSQTGSADIELSISELDVNLSASLLPIIPGFLAEGLAEYQPETASQIIQVASQPTLDISVVEKAPATQRMSSDDDEHSDLQKEFDTLLKENRRLKQQAQKDTTGDRAEGAVQDHVAETDHVAEVSNVDVPDIGEAVQPSDLFVDLPNYVLSSSGSSSSHDVTEQDNDVTPPESSVKRAFLSGPFFTDFEFAELPGVQGNRKHTPPEESPSTPTNDLSVAVGSALPGSSTDSNLPENIPADEDTPLKRGTFSRIPAPWHKPRFPASGAVEFLPFDESDLVGDGIEQHEDHMDIEDEDEDEEDEDDDMGFDIDLESEEEEHDTMDHRPLRKRIWDDDVVLKRQFSALIPAFDPRPGRNNVAHTTDVEVAAPGAAPFEVQTSRVGKEPPNKPRLALFIRAPALPGVRPQEYLCPEDRTLFSCIVAMSTRERGGYMPTSVVRRLWEPTYTLVYRETRPSDTHRRLNQECDPFDSLPFKPKWEFEFVRKYLGTERLAKIELLNYLQAQADSIWLKKWRLTGSPKSIKKCKSCSNLASAYKDFLQHTAVSDKASRDLEKEWYKEFSDCLLLLNIVHSALVQDTGVEADEEPPVTQESFQSGRLTTRLMQQVQEPLILATRSIPAWCDKVVNQFPMLIPFETRSVYFNATAFGISRSIHWLQNMRDTAEQRPRTVSVRRQDELGEFRIGRLKHERCTIPRGEDFLDWSLQVLNSHSTNKSVLEIEFKGEEGTGIGPTLEFYSLVAAELQRKDKAMWICEDEEEEQPASQDVDLGQGPKPPGYYVKPGPNGLFPAPYPQDSPRLARICALFHMLGMFLGKSLQDQRLVDLPLSLPFFKMICKGADYISSPDSSDDSDCEDNCESLLKSESLSSLTESEARYRCDSDAASDISSAQGSLDTMDTDRKSVALTIEDMAPLLDTSSESSGLSKPDRQQAGDRQPSSPWFAGLLNNLDFASTNPYLAKFLFSLDALAEQKRAISADAALTEAEKWESIEQLTLPSKARVEDLCLYFQFSPASKVHGYSALDLKPGGDSIPVTIQNIEEFSDLTRSFCLDTGIRKQMEAFKAGFTEVFPISHLRMFSPVEVRLLLCGEMSPDWSRQDLLDYTEPKFGYTKDSTGFLNLVEVLCEMSGGERKNFLQFSTGCSSLPPGGLANLHPRLTVVKKEGEGDTALPSVNTCVHYLKLPDYSSKQVLKQKLFQSTQEKGFHLN